MKGLTEDAEKRFEDLLNAVSKAAGILAPGDSIALVPTSFSESRGLTEETQAELEAVIVAYAQKCLGFDERAIGTRTPEDEIFYVTNKPNIFLVNNGGKWRIAHRVGINQAPQLGRDVTEIVAAFRETAEERIVKAGLPSHEPSLALRSQTKTILNSTATLLEGGTIEDQIDRKIIEDAAAFIENPTENLADIEIHTTNVSAVCAGYEMQDADVPDEIKAMSKYLFALQCVNRMRFVENKLAHGASALSPEIQLAMKKALDWATIVSDGWYKNDKLLHAVTALQTMITSAITPAPVL